MAAQHSPSPGRRPKLFIIDAMGLAYRSFFAFGRTSLQTNQKMPTGAIFGTAMFMNKLISEERPTYLVAALDSPGPNFRHELYRDYKAHRDKMPDDLSKQLPVIFDLLEKFKCRVIQVPGVEADDTIATLARKFKGQDIDIFIVSGDKDFMQLVDERTFLYSPKKNEEPLVVDIKGVHDRFGCTPAQMIDVLALMGDTADNVPGVSGIGEKGAAKLIQTYGSLDGVYDHLGEISAKKQREGLVAGRDDAYLSRKLVTLKDDVPLPVDLADIEIDPDHATANDELLKIYQTYEFQSLAAKVRGKATSTPSSLAKDVEPSGDHTAETSGAAALTEISANDAAGFAHLLKEAEKDGVLAVVSSPEQIHDLVVDRPNKLTFATTSGSYFGITLNEAGVFRCRELLEKGSVTKIGHGLKSMMEGLANCGLDLRAPFFDLEVADYLIDPNNYDHSLEAIAQRVGTSSAADSSTGDSTPTSHAATILATYEPLRSKLESMGLHRVMYDIEMPLIPVLAAMEREGFYVDAEQLDHYSGELDHAAKDLEERLYREAGGAFNVNSPKQLQELLFEKLKLHEAAGMSRLKRTKTGFSTDESVLTRLAAVHPVPKLIIEYRSVSKLKNTYVDSLPQFINPKSGKLHTSFRQTVAATGRLSSDRPNLQNIPMRTALGRRIRKAFRPKDPGCLLISADYSQVELRLLAHLSQDPGLIEAFKKGVDVHTATAAKIFRVAEAEVTPLLRSRAKAVNFGIIYGMGPQRLAQDTGVKCNEAKDFIARYFDAFPAIEAYTASLVESAKKLGYCTTITGRRRPIPEMSDSNRALQARGENIAVNAPIQGSAADLIKLAMIRVDHAHAAHRYRTRLSLQVHDELVFTAPKDEITPVVELVRDAMENALETSVPLKVEIHWGEDWLLAHG